MTSVLSNLSGSIGGVVGGTKNWVAEQWTQRVVQVSVYAAIVFFVLSSYPLIAFVEKHVWNVFGVKLGKEGTLALHSVIFGLFMYVGTRYILDPLMGRVVEGITNPADGDVLDLNTELKDQEAAHTPSPAPTKSKSKMCPGLVEMWNYQDVRGQAMKEALCKHECKGARELSC